MAKKRGDAFENLLINGHNRFLSDNGGILAELVSNGTQKCPSTRENEDAPDIQFDDDELDIISGVEITPDNLDDFLTP